VDEAGLQATAAVFAARGYVIVPSAVADATVAATLAAVAAIEDAAGDLPDDLVERWLVLEPADTGGPEMTGASNRRRIFIIGDPIRFRPDLAAVMTHPVSLQVACTLLGATGIRYHFGNVTTKQPGSTRAVSWHRDYPNRYMCPRGSSFVRVMLCLDGMDATNGATQFLPGSHLVSDDEAIAAEHDGHAVNSSSGGVEVATCPAGSLVFIHPKVLHGGPANLSGRPRRNIIVQWGIDDDPVCIYVDAESLTGVRVEPH
jgi:phytanoyl-CoA hydroxylase